MIASLMVYGVVIATLVGLAALAVERSFAVLKRPRRVVWALALVSSLALPIAMVSANHAPTVSKPSADTAMHRDFAVEAPSDDSPLLLPIVSSAIEQARWPSWPDLDNLLTAAWFASSLGIVAFFAAGWLGLRRAARKWDREQFEGSTVFVADQSGPAIVGFLKPQIVIPRWLLDASPSRRAMVMAHERTHIAAHDPLLVLAAIVLVAFAPWNLALLWQLRRLRFAIEVDCDSRVLRGGVAPSAYGEMLLVVGQRNAGMPVVAIALTEPASQLERRIRVMMSGAYRHAKLVAVACICVSILPVVAGAQLKAPADSPPVQGSGTTDTDMKHFKSSEWGFELDIPQGWNAFPPVSANSPYEVIRFASHEDGNRNLLIIFRNPHDPKEDPNATLDKVQDVLTKGGFSNFTRSETRIGSKVVKTLDFDKMLNGRLWSVRQFFIIDGTLMHVLGFGTTDRDSMFPLFDQISKTFRYEGSRG